MNNIQDREVFVLSFLVKDFEQATAEFSNNWPNGNVKLIPKFECEKNGILGRVYCLNKTINGNPTNVDFDSVLFHLGQSTIAKYLNK